MNEHWIAFALYIMSLVVKHWLDTKSSNRIYSQIAKHREIVNASLQALDLIAKKNEGEE